MAGQHKKSIIKQAGWTASLLILVLWTGTCSIAAAKTQSTEETAQAQEKTGSADKDQKNKQEELKNIFDVEKQAQIENDLKVKREKNNYTEKNMLIVNNPFGTNSQSAYVYFKTENKAKVYYTIKVSDKSIKDFTQKAYQKEEYQKEHEFEITGLIPNMENKVEFTIVNQDGQKVTRQYAYNMGSIQGDEALRTEKNEDKDKFVPFMGGLTALPAVQGRHMNFTCYYDAAGNLRGEVPLPEGAKGLLGYDDDYVYYGIGDNKAAAVNRIGQVTSIDTDTGQKK